MSCPRCSRMNDRSPVILGLKFLAVIVFVCTVKWVLRVDVNGGIEPTGDDNMAAPTQATAIALPGQNEEQK